MLLVIMAMAFCGGLIQGMTGFGSVIVMMLVLPTLFMVPQAAGISSAIELLLCCLMAYQYRKFVNFKKALTPAFLYLGVSSFSALYSMKVNQALMLKVLGVFLILLSIYFLFFSTKEKKPLSLPLSIACLVGAGMCDGLFGIGGPLMVLYFLTQTTSTEEYLGSIQAFFMVSSIYMAIFRFISGILNISHIPYILCGMVGIFLGLQVANKIVDRVNGELLKKFTYVMIGIAGIINIL